MFDRVLTCLLCNIAVQSTEDDINLILELFRLAILHHKISQLFAHGHTLLPLDSIFVLLARRPGAGSNSRKLETRVQSKQEDESLANAASGSQNT